MCRLNSRIKSERGTALIEHALLLALIAFSTVFSTSYVGKSCAQIFRTAATGGGTISNQPPIMENG